MSESVADRYEHCRIANNRWLWGELGFDLIEGNTATRHNAFLGVVALSILEDPQYQNREDMIMRAEGIREAQLAKRSLHRLQEEVDLAYDTLGIGHV